MIPFYILFSWEHLNVVKGKFYEKTLLCFEGWAPLTVCTVVWHQEAQLSKKQTIKWVSVKVKQQAFFCWISRKNILQNSFLGHNPFLQTCCYVKQRFVDFPTHLRRLTKEISVKIFNCLVIFFFCRQEWEWGWTESTENTQATSPAFFANLLFMFLVRPSQHATLEASLSSLSPQSWASS